MVGIPSEVTPSFSILDIETIDVDRKIHLCPVATPMVERDDNQLPSDQGELLLENSTVYDLDAFTPSQPVSLVVAGMIRSQRVARVSFMPFQYNPAQEHLRVIQHITIELQLGSDDGWYDPAKQIIDEGPSEALLQNLLINYDQALKWRIRYEPSPQAFELPAFFTR